MNNRTLQLLKSKVESLGYNLYENRNTVSIYGKAYDEYGIEEVQYGPDPVEYFNVEKLPGKVATLLPNIGCSNGQLYFGPWASPQFKKSVAQALFEDDSILYTIAFHLSAQLDWASLNRALRRKAYDLGDTNALNHSDA